MTYEVQYKESLMAIHNHLIDIQEVKPPVACDLTSAAPPEKLNEQEETRCDICLRNLSIC